MYDIHKIYKMLSLEESTENQSIGITLAQEISDLSLLIQPPAAPSVWESCASILSQKSDEILAPYLDELLEWLQDLNWPGALIILERLMIFSSILLKDSIEKAVTKAINQNNEDGLRWLDYLSELLDNEKLKAALPNEIAAELQKHYHNWGAWYGD